MSGAVISVTGGIHAGASMQLAEGYDIVIGNGAEDDFVLVDDGVMARHATVRLNSDLLILVAHHPGVCVFGNALTIGRSSELRRGAWFAVGDARLQFSGHELLTPKTVRAAELAWLRTYMPLVYLRRCWVLLSRGMKLSMLCALVCILGGWLWRVYGPHPVVQRTAGLDGPFSFVTVQEDPKNHTCTYRGYVAKAADLSALASVVRRSRCPSALRVRVVEQMQEQLAEFLAKYYRGAKIRATKPGAFVIDAPAEDAYLLPESWDYARIARLARNTIDGLGELGFEGHALDGGPVHAPLGAIAMNLTRSANGAWLVDARGARYFAGAQLKLGKLLGISGCTVTVMRDDDATLYQFRAQGGEGIQACE